ncbi:ras gtpase [Anaeramoeba ignava]|uniref:Ras gtpase n=1 Tax=Anaeramoeba ignava TaxID=1746090 RepID=A0A9Q0R7X7_ANAIG|nr:ras gtpase [Anaeramoeba ignava]
MNLDNDNELQLRIGLFGAGGVGKSTITIRFIQNIFIGDYDPTIEEEYRKIFDLNDKKISLNTLDTARGEEYYQISWRWARYSQVFVYVYSITDRDSFERIIDFHKSATKCLDGNENYRKILIGNKNDLFTKRVVKTKEGKELANKLNCKFIETSAKNVENINQLFYEASILGIGELKNPKKNQKKNQNKNKKGKCLLM